MNTQVVWKFPLSRRGRNALEIPVGAKVLHVGFQTHVPHIWILVDPDAPKEKVIYWVIGTGHGMPAEILLEHVGTALSDEESYVWHVFEEIGGAIPPQKRDQNDE